MKTADRHKLVPASYLVLMKEGKILLLRRFNTGYEDGNYSMVAGHVDVGEAFTQTLVREAEEEAGILLKSEDVKVVHVMHRKAEDSERVDVFLMASRWVGEITNKEPYKCDDLSWFELSNLPLNIVPCVRSAIECIKKGVFYSEFGWGEKV